MAHGPEVRAAARAAYVYEAQPLEAIGARLSVSLSSLSGWKKRALKGGDDWDKARAAARLSASGTEGVNRMILEQFVTLFQSTLTELKDTPNVGPMQKAEAISRLSDAYHKTMNAISKSSPQLNKLAVAMEVLKHQADFIKSESRDAAGVEYFLTLIEPFAERLVKIYG